MAKRSEDDNDPDEIMRKVFGRFVRHKVNEKVEIPSKVLYEYDPYEELRERAGK